jgi:hypothetical protein
MTAKVI